MTFEAGETGGITAEGGERPISPRDVRSAERESPSAKAVAIDAGGFR